MLDLPPPLEATRCAPRDLRKDGRPFHDAVLMFKVRALQLLYALSHEQVELQIAHQCFLGWGIGHVVPNYTAAWRFRETFKGCVIEALFARLGVARHAWLGGDEREDSGCETGGEAEEGASRRRQIKARPR